MNLSDCFKTTVPSAAPGFPEQNDSFAASLKKRKRDPSQEDAVNLGHSTTFMPSHNPSFRLDRPEVSKDHDEFPYRHRCLPRKRRVLQQPYFQQQAYDGLRPPHINTAQKFLSPNLCVPANSNFSSPPVSPKTLIPISYPPPASLLRPCHICHRRPTTKEVLDAYADCDLCGQRACYICLRQCDAADCCGLNLLGASHLFRDGSDRLHEDVNGDGCARQPRKICSCCAVEGVTDTGMEVVRCLDCVRGPLSQWQSGQG